jgi:N-acetylneuraminic acid mutarotase
MVVALVSSALRRMALAAVIVLTPVMAQAGWSEGAPVADARAFGSAAAQGDTVYVAGGGALAGPVSDFAAYDLVGDIWRPLPTMPVGRQNFGMAVAADGGVYVSGGFAGDAFDAPASDFWRYDITNAVWVRMADMPAGRARHGMVAIDGDLYVVGGEGPNASRVFVYDTFKAVWRDLGADLPTPRTDLGVVAANGRVMVLGGRTGSGVTAQVHVYDPASGRWSRAADLPMPLADAAVGTVNGTIHVAGGRSNDPMRTFKEHYVLAAGSQSWRTSEALPLPRLGAAAAGTARGFLVIGGSGGAGVFSVFTASDVVDIYRP